FSLKSQVFTGNKPQIDSQAKKRKIKRMNELITNKRSAQI
ncbi:8665_t:CDS:1, partial [Funneliformis caledonium]